MDFQSLREYFYKLANRCYLLILLPLGGFLYLYGLFQTDNIAPLIKDETTSVEVVVLLFVLSLINLTTVHWAAKQRLKKYQAETGLARKLDRFVEITLFRIGACSAASLLLALGLLLTGSEYFGFGFLVILFWALLQWPSSRRACKDLRLRGDEYEMVFYKKDKF
jgi:hypothetical protein